MFDIWTKKEPLAEEVYRGKNYKIIENPEYPVNRCILYFSSNDIWFPNTEEAFRYSFIERDYYEWTRHGARFGKKAIFFRDIYKSWYTTGVSAEASSIDSLLAFIRKETEGMEIVTVGSSAGGYMAALVASILNAKYAISFSAQFNLYEESCIAKNPILQKYKNEERNQYFRLKEWIEKGTAPIYYIMPSQNGEDQKQYEYIKGTPNVKTLKIKTPRHGVPVLRGNIEKFLSLEKAELDEIFDGYHGKEISRVAFSANLSGWGKTIGFLKDELIRQMKKRLKF